MYKQLLNQTLPLYTGLDKDLLQQRSGINPDRFNDILDANVTDDITLAEYSAIAKALPSSISCSIKSLSDATEELEYLEVQLVNLSKAADDDQLPLFTGMARLVRRVVATLS